MDKYSKKMFLVLIVMLSFFIGIVIFCAKDINRTSTRMIHDDNNEMVNSNILIKEEKKEEKSSNSNKISNKISNKTSNKQEEKKSNSNVTKEKKDEPISNEVKNKEEILCSNNQQKVEKKYIDKVPVFTFHRLVPNNIKEKYFKDNQWFSSVEKFEEMMKYLHNNHYRTISTLEFYDWYIGNIEYDEKVVLITFDDGYIEDYTLAYPILKKYNLKSTSFVIGKHVKPVTNEYNLTEEDYSKNPQLFMGQDIIDKLKIEYPNFDFQSHSYDLHTKIKVDEITRIAKVHTLTEEEIDNDVKKTLKFGFKTMAYPFGEYNEVIQEKLKDNGYLLAFTFGGHTYGYATRESDQYAINRIKIDGNDDLRSFVKWLIY
jgi:peptidoglycan/xylan/chitin deacetylase (PgdA/CDA1 family)/gas vesicle protein